MKFITIDKSPLWTSVFMAMFLALPVLQGCREDEPVKWVDLRYDNEESYLIDAAGEATVSFRVKSTDPWTVFGANDEDWYTITPASGDGGDIYTVTVSCKENKDLDDRSDIIYIKSDYWTGSEFLLTQKGIAYLDVEEFGNIAQEGDSPLTIEVKSNQDWTAEVTEGNAWLSIKEGTSGNGNMSIVLGATKNSGEQRSGQITVYDRHNVPAQLLTITQDGVLLMPLSPENGSYFVLYEQAQELRIPVTSNAVWSVSKDNPEEDWWYDIKTVNFEGDGEIVVDVQEYELGGGIAVRTGTIVLSTEAADDVTPVVKTVRFKQASPDANRTETHNGEALTSSPIVAGSQPMGTYNFYVAPFSDDTQIKLYFIWEDEAGFNGNPSFAELRFWLNTNSAAPMTTELSCMPYSNKANQWMGYARKPIDNTSQVKMTLTFGESEPDAGGNTWLYTAWYLNDELIVEDLSDGLDANNASDTWKVAYSRLAAAGGATINIWASAGSATLDKWEYISPLNWGE